MNSLVNQAGVVSWMGFFQAILGTGSLSAVTIGAVLSVATAIGISFINELSPEAIYL